ncbi:Gfo/Idh/MocA family oxidoreductase [Salipaludibacillus sp. CUR1]|uniref:Gfo/Idh/MocA family protein n=1 Tax=Salipaludibacillus sp. CUR1 TaxID=2820003 RepID=UPI001E4EE016|nr:Gfo/Idh/MocA family oxidoreductase [Salipaludibacillus sp. CUR1]MCE7791714.1 Gfo/Idh/MocA family oxidoreductase [Salipaludibacillus sp. CUR1]
MAKVGVIGLGDIAEKAYLPVLSEVEGVEIHLFTRNQAKLKKLGERYRYSNLHDSLDSLIGSGVEAAFVHSSTESHEEIVRALLEADIHVFVDKPITYYYETAKALVELADSRGLLLMTGFNRRYAPSYQRLKEIGQPNMAVIQKNRRSLPGEVREFVFDDFIHVVDSLRYLFPYTIEKLTVTGRKKDSVLHHVVLQFESAEGTAIGIMNRDSGTTEEKAEVMGPEEKGMVYNVAELVIRRGREEIKPETSDWEPTLHKRGFVQMVADFLQAIQTGKEPLVTNQDGLLTHEICERVISELE